MFVTYQLVNLLVTYQLVNLVATHITIGTEGMGSIPGPVKFDTARQRIVNAATFLRSCVARR